MWLKVPRGKYVVAVSGGADSCVLLDLLANHPGLELVVAHVDHGIRRDSAADARFVEALARLYGLPFRSHHLHLGADASEELARRGRYAFLQKVAQEEKADALITAHHADDVLETIVLNLLRGTGWRGLCSLRSHGSVLRPLLARTKQEIYHYAVEHGLEWHEDETNTGDLYTRNYIRHRIIPACLKKDARFASKLRNLYDAQLLLRDEIETLLAEFLNNLVNDGMLDKMVLLELDEKIAFEVIRGFLISQNVRQTSPQLMRILEFVRTAGNAKRFSLDARHFLEIRREGLVVVTTEK